MALHNVLILGAGRIGVAVAALLAKSQEYHVSISDIRAPVNDFGSDSIRFVKLDITDAKQVKDYIHKSQIKAIISCLPFHLTIEVAKIAAATGIDYFDPTEDVATTKFVSQLAKENKSSFAPQCGLAPGFISIAANSLVAGFDEVDTVKMRVGALTPSVSNSFQYAFTWSVEGVINEYIKPCLVMDNGKSKLVSALDGLERLVINDQYYEAFYTSGGVGSLVESFLGRVKNMDYKTIRYLGHCEKMKFILQDMKLGDNPELAKQILTKVIPYADDDKVIIYVSVSGIKDGRFCEVNYTNTCFPTIFDGTKFSAIQMTTASAICTIVDLVVHERKFAGLIRQEQISLEQFLSNRFGCYYKKKET